MSNFLRQYLPFIYYSINICNQKVPTDPDSVNHVLRDCYSLLHFVLHVLLGSSNKSDIFDSLEIFVTYLIFGYAKSSGYVFIS